MKLHLPKGLFIAVLAAISSIAPTTSGADTISVNFASNADQTTTNKDGELGGVDADGWNNSIVLPTNSVTADKTVEVTNQSGAAAGSIRLQNIANTWSSKIAVGDTLTSVIQRGYIDVPSQSTRIYTVTLQHGYWISDAYFYMSADTDSQQYASLNINGTSYTGGTDKAVNQPTSWGTTDSGTTDANEKKLAGVVEYNENNSIKVTNLTGNLVVKNDDFNASGQGGIRATLAGLQVVDRSADSGYRTTLNSGETAASGAIWKLGEETVDYASIPAGKKYLGITANAAGSTIRLSGGETVDSLAAIANSLTITADNAVTITDLYTYSGAAITLNTTATVNSLRGDVNLQISQNKSLKLSGLVTLSKESAITGDGTVVVQDGGELQLNTSGNTSSVRSHIAVSAGGKLTLMQGDALGWDNPPKSITLTGESATKQALVSITGKQTTVPDITLNGFSKIEGGQIQLYGCDITARNTGNIITSAIQSSIHACAITVDANGELEFQGNIGKNSSENANGKLTKKGAGEVTFSGGDSHFYRLYTNEGGTTVFKGSTTSFDEGINITGGGVTFESGTTSINLGKNLFIGADSTVAFNGQTLTLNGSNWMAVPVLTNSSITQNGEQQFSFHYTIATGNVAGITGTVKLSGTEEQQQIINGTVSGNKNYYVIAENNTQYDKNAHANIENFEGYVVTNGATFDLCLTQTEGFQPHLYLDAGTTIQNTGSNRGTNAISILNMYLLGDATVNATKGYQYGMLRDSFAESTLSLNGNTLTKTGDGIFHLVNTTVNDGTIDVQEGTLYIDKHNNFANGTTFNNVKVNVATGALMQIQSMKDAATVGGLLAATSGTGTIELKTNAVFEGVKTNDASGNPLGNIDSIDPERMQFEGDIKVSNKAKLSIGSSEEGHRWGWYTDLSALKSIQLTDAQLFYTGRSCTLQSLIINTGTDADYTSSLRIWEIDQNEALTINSLTLHEDLEVQANWNMALNINALTGAGNLNLGSNAKGGGNASYNVTVGAGYTGIISVLNKYAGSGDSTDRASLAVTIAKDATLKSTQLVKGANGTVTLKGSGSYEVDKDTLSTAIINGLKETAWTGKVAFSGASFSNTDLNNYGNAGSTIRIHNSSGSITNGTIVSDIEFVETSDASAFDLKGTNAANLVFAGNISGKGNFGYAESSGHQVSFTGDVAEWKGILWASAASEVTYSDNAKVISNAISAGQGATSTVNFVNTDGMQVASDINTQGWSNGTLNLKVSNDEKATGTVEFSGAIFNGTTGNGKVATSNLTVETGAAAKFSNSAVQFNDILVEAQAQLAFTGAEALSVSKLELQQGAAVSVGTVENPQGTLTVTKEAVFNGGQVNANLTLGSGAKVTMGSALTMGTPTAPASEPGSPASTGYTLSLEKGITLKLQDDLLNQLNNLTASSEPLVLITGVNTLQLGEQTYTVGSQVLTDAKSVSLSDYITIEGFEQYYVSFNSEGSVIAGLSVPEPTTTTLSLLALAGLCARRRRK